jgi:DNA-binding NtrC family response regulator
MKKESTAIVVAEKELIPCDICQKLCKGQLGVTMHKSKAHTKKKKTIERKAHAKTAEKVIEATVEEHPLELIAYTVGRIEGDIQRIAHENGIPAKHFTKRCAEYLLHAARR